MVTGQSPLVLLHGFSGAPASWDRVVSLLPSDLPVLRPRLTGHGASWLGVSSFEDEVDRLAAGLRAEAVAGAVLCGYSLGGRIALGLLVRHGGLFRRAVLIGAHPGLDDPKLRAERVAADERWAQLLETQGVEAFADAWASQGLFASQHQLGEAELSLQRNVRLAHDNDGLARAMRVLGLGAMPNLLPALASVGLPLHFVAGELDPKFRALAEAMTNAVPGARATVVPGCGHNVVLENPAAIAALLGKEGRT